MTCKSYPLSRSGFFFSLLKDRYKKSYDKSLYNKYTFFFLFRLSFLYIYTTHTHTHIGFSVLVIFKKNVIFFIEDHGKKTKKSSTVSVFCKICITKNLFYGIQSP